MAAPTSATDLALGLPNMKSPISDPQGFVTQAWRYFFGSTAQKSHDIDPNFTLAVSPVPTQAEVQALSDQVSLLSKQLGLI